MGPFKIFKSFRKRGIVYRKTQGDFEEKNTIDKLNAMIIFSMDTEIQNLYDFLHFSHNQRNVKVMHA